VEAPEIVELTPLPLATSLRRVDWGR